ncbi:MAG: mannonate dehydratase [Pseudomonadota bacterium]
MKQCWRWFGPNDAVHLADLHQVGVEGIVTALHDIPPGEIWSIANIQQRADLLRTAGFNWDVVESLPVSEVIKTQAADLQIHLENYKESLRNLARQGIKTVCYNFMPVLDWTRTTLRARQSHGGNAMQFRLADFAIFDLHILKRGGAASDYSEQQCSAAEEQFRAMDDGKRKVLQDTIVAGLPGANDSWHLEDVRALLGTYAAIDETRLRQNMIDFLSEVCPLAETLGIRMCCHPDDPPYPLMGLPRIMSCTQDYAQIMKSVDTPANGSTLCTGSLGVAEDFDPVEFIERLGPRIHFVHLRNTKRLASEDARRPDFFEAAHLEGDTDMVATIKALASEQERRKSEGRSDWDIPMRPDHGQELLSDLKTDSMPGYPLIGRMRGLAELRGIMAASGS